MHRIIALVILFAAQAAAQQELPQDPAALGKLLDAPAERRAIAGYRPALQLEYRRYERPRPIRLWIATVRGQHPDVRFSVTPPTTFAGDDAAFETACANTLEFARDGAFELAINTSAFRPFRAAAGQPMDIVGLAAHEGRVFSSAEPSLGALLIDRDKRLRVQGPPLPTDDIWHVASGFQMLLDDGRIVVDPERARSRFGGINPRTAVATDKAGETLWIVVADGRQEGVSMGLTLVELAVLFDSLGAWDALNLDGGGSSTLVICDDEGEHVVVNTPVGVRAPNSLRLVAANLGLDLPGEGPDAETLPRPASAATQPKD